MAMISAARKQEVTKQVLLKAAGLSNAYLNYKRHILPALDAGLIERTLPDKPSSRLQKYRLTP
jgi:ATP-dependent DNA helicase RecG